MLAQLDAMAGRPVAILITVPYHTRSAEPLRERYGATIHGHPAVTKRLRDTTGFSAIEPGAQLPGGARAFAIGKPRRHETPIHLPSHRALALGDAIVTTPEGELRMWHNERVDAARARWYRDVFAPTAAPLLELDLERILVTHGEPILHDGHAALAGALDAAPWYRALAGRGELEARPDAVLEERLRQPGGDRVRGAPAGAVRGNQVVG